MSYDFSLAGGINCELAHSTLVPLVNSILTLSSFDIDKFDFDWFRSVEQTECLGCLSLWAVPVPDIQWLVIGNKESDNTKKYSLY